MNPSAEDALTVLLEGNERFRSGQSFHHRYLPEDIARLAVGQAPRAAIVACSDGRVSPEIIFDQPLANLFVSRVPGNVASDSAKWMLEIAVTNMRVPLVIVMGHTECLAVRQVLEGEAGAGGTLRDDVARAVKEVRAQPGEDLFREAVKQNARQTTQALLRESSAVQEAVQASRLELVTALYDVHTGQVELV